MFVLESDRNLPPLIMVALRGLRIVGVLTALLFPGLYVALVSVNPEILRIELALSVAQSRADVPYPALIEILMMLLTLELIIEASVRLPKSIGPTITMVGGIIIGQAVVEAKLVSGLLIIVLAATTIANSTINGLQNSLSIRLFKYIIVILAAIYGVLGLLAGIVLVSAYLASIKAFDVSYLYLHLKKRMGAKVDKSLHVILMFLLTHLGLIFFMFPGNIVSSTEQGHWFPILFGFVLTFILISLYMKGLSYFPKQDIITIYSDIGKAATVFFLLPITVYLLMIIVVMVRAYSEIITIVFLTNTRLWAIMALLLIISTYLATKGVETIFRTGILLSILFLLPVLFIFFTTFQNVDWRYIIPFTPRFDFMTKPSYLKSYFAFSGGFLYLGFVQPYLSYSRKKSSFSRRHSHSFLYLFRLHPCSYIWPRHSIDAVISICCSCGHRSINVADVRQSFYAFLLSLITFVMLYISLVLWMTGQIVSKWISAVQPSI